MNYWTERAEVSANRMVAWLGVGSSKYYDWKKRYGKVNEHNGSVPRDFWLEEWEKQEILKFHSSHPLEGYRRLTFMMLDADIVAVSPSSVYRVLREAGVMDRWNAKRSKKGTGFHQPLRPHDHWHVDISYLNICGTFYFMCSILDGCSRAIVHWEIREQMQEIDVEVVLQRARERYPNARPRVITDNGPQFVARDFKEFIRIAGMTHVKTSPYYPQSNGKIERYHRTIKGECIRTRTLVSLDAAREAVTGYVHHYNEVRLHSAIGYVTPRTKLEGNEQQVFDN
ncbi:MAG: IS3 family transposase, partial [Bdellovibrionales bacterium]|nr:IS3 family transposase [Bdellovibrionales bacterium]